MNESFKEKKIESITNLYEKAIRELPIVPAPDEYGYVRIRYQDLRFLLKNRCDIAYSDGFFYGLVICKKD